jgi:hypothetical protein
VRQANIDPTRIESEIVTVADTLLACDEREEQWLRSYQLEADRRDGLPAGKFTWFGAGSMKKRDSISELGQMTRGSRAGWSGANHYRIDPDRFAHSALAK